VLRPGYARTTYRELSRSNKSNCSAKRLPKQKLLVPCSIRDVAIGEHCKVYSGLSRRKEPHEERKYEAVQAIEEDYGPVSVTTAVGTRSSSRGSVDTQR
jgi:hypothetical protein